MRVIFAVFSILYVHFLIGQTDTIIIADLTDIMIEIDKSGQIRTVTDFAKADMAGFFLEESLEGAIRVCNEEETHFYVNGRLIDIFSGCISFEVKGLQRKFKSDSLYLSIYSSKGISNLTCENVIYEKLKIVKEVTAETRSQRNVFNEFLIIASLTTLMLYGWIINSNQARRNYIFRKSFSLKLSSYEFINTTFLSQSNFQFLVLISQLVGLLYLIDIFYIEDQINSLSLFSLVSSWMRITGVALLLLVGKYILVSLVSILFRFQKMNDFQLFDFENFMLLSLSLVSALFFIGYIFFKPLQIFIQSQLNPILVLFLLIFLAWFGFKIVNNSSRKKLQIISYLCATEIIPAILLYIEISK